MASVRVTLVDVYVVRHGGARLEVLLLRRAPGDRSPGSWEAVHGHLVAGELPVAGALRELREETGLRPERMYNLSRVESFYLHGSDEVAMIPAFVAWAPRDAAVRLSQEHDAAEWLLPSAALRRASWPRSRRAIADIDALFDGGDAGPMEDVLRIS